MALTSKHLDQELNTLEDTSKNVEVYQAAIIRIGILALRLLRDIRSNQVKIGKKSGVQFATPRKTTTTGSDSVDVTDSKQKKE